MKRHLLNSLVALAIIAMTLIVTSGQPAALAAPVRVDVDPCVGTWATVSIIWLVPSLDGKQVTANVEWTVGGAGATGVHLESYFDDALLQSGSRLGRTGVEVFTDHRPSPGQHTYTVKAYPMVGDFICWQNGAEDTRLVQPVEVDLGWFVKETDTDLHHLSARGVNIVVMQTRAAFPGWQSREEAYATLHAALKNVPPGVQVWLQVYSQEYMHYYQLCRQKKSIEYCRQILEPLKDLLSHVGGIDLKNKEQEIVQQRMNEDLANKIRGWYLYQEPEYSYLADIEPIATSDPLPTISVETLKEFNDYVRSNDSTGRPTLLVNSEQVAISNARGALMDWRGIADFHGIADYPKLGRDQPNFEPYEYGGNPDYGWWTVPTVLDALATEGPKSSGSTSYYIAQGQGDPTHGPGPCCKLAVPSQREIRWSIWTPLIKGLRGVLFWWWSGSGEFWNSNTNPGEPPTIREAVAAVFNELQIHRLDRRDNRDFTILGILSAGKDHTQDVRYDPPNPKLAGMALRSYEGHWYFLVSDNVDKHPVRDTDGSRKVTFTLTIPPPPQVCPDPLPEKPMKIPYKISEMISGTENIPVVVTCSRVQVQVELKVNLMRGDVQAYDLW